MTKPHINSITPDHMAQLMNTIAMVSALTPQAHGLLDNLTKKAREGNFDAPSSYGALANTLFAMSEGVNKLVDIKSNYELDPDDQMDLQDGRGLALDMELGSAALMVATAAGLMVFAIDRTLVPQTAIEALNMTANVLAEPLPFPDDADPDLLDHNQTNLAYANKVRDEFEQAVVKAATAAAEDQPEAEDGDHTVH